MSDLSGTWFDSMVIRPVPKLRKPKKPKPVLWDPQVVLAPREQAIKNWAKAQAHVNLYRHWADSVQPGARHLIVLAKLDRWEVLAQRSLIRALWLL